MNLIEAFNVMRKAAENSHGTLGYHQNLQAAIEVVAQVVIKESQPKAQPKAQPEVKETED